MNTKSKTLIFDPSDEMVFILFMSERILSKKVLTKSLFLMLQISPNISRSFVEKTDLFSPFLLLSKILINLVKPLAYFHRFAHVFTGHPISQIIIK